jgi:hypothetical protein
MLNNSFIKLLLIGLTTISFSQCGIITKTRYNQGLKLNFGGGRNSTNYDSTHVMNIAAHKAQQRLLTHNDTFLPKLKKTKSAFNRKTKHSPKRRIVKNMSNSNEIAHPLFQQPLFQISDTTKPAAQAESRKEEEYEKATNTARLVFYGSIITLIIAAVTLLALLAIASGIGIIIGFILAIRARFKIRDAKTKDEDRKNLNKKRANLIITIFGVFFSLAVLLVVAYALNPF